MSRLTQRLTRELEHIADHATPSPGALAAIRARIEARADEPDVEVIMLAPNEKQRNRKWIAVALAAAAVVVVVVIGAVAFTGDDNAAPDTAVTPDPPPVDDATPAIEASDPLDVAESYMAARDRWDGEATASWFAAGAMFDYGYETVEELVANAAFEQAIGFRLLDPSCAVDSVGPPAEVACTFTVQNTWSEALGSGPLVDSGFVLVIADGRIQELREEPGFDPGFGTAWVVFRDWIGDNHPEDVDSMYEPGGVRLDDAAIALFEQYTAEFEAFQVANEYLDAVNAWDGAATAALLADGALEDGTAMIEANADFERAIGFQLLDPTCSTASVEASVEVTCAFTVQNAWSEALGSGPLDDSGSVYVVVDGKITDLREEPGFDPGFGTAWVVFRNWIEDNHPADLDTMYEAGGAVRLTPEAVALFEERTAEFVAAQGG